jgi:hypothetical protein
MVGLAAVGLALSGLLTVGVLVGLLRPSIALGRVEHELHSLRAEVVGYRAAHEHLVSSLDRRLDGLEQTAAHAANELRMAADQVSARFAVEHAARNGETT